MFHGLATGLTISAANKGGGLPPGGAGLAFQPCCAGVRLALATLAPLEAHSGADFPTVRRFSGVGVTDGADSGFHGSELCCGMVLVCDVEMEMRRVLRPIGARVNEVHETHFRPGFDPVENAVGIDLGRVKRPPAFALSVSARSPTAHKAVSGHNGDGVRFSLFRGSVVLVDHGGCLV